MLLKSIFSQHAQPQYNAGRLITPPPASVNTQFDDRTVSKYPFSFAVVVPWLFVLDYYRMHIIF